MSIRYGGRREIGYQRQENQDQVSRFSSPHGEVFLLADGMGGHENGGVAANMAITGFERHFLSLAGQMPLNAALAEAASLINADIHARGHAGSATTATMGSTLALLVVQKEHFVTAHIGDSRVYLFRDGRLKQLTRDHTAMQKMLDAGLMTPEETRTHPDASVLTRALGQGETMELEISEPYPLLDGDVLMLCSDGLSGYVEDGPIEDRLRRYEEPQRAADALAELALEAGGFDNISVWVVRASNAPPEPANPSASPPVEHRQGAGGEKAPPPAKKHRGRWLAMALLLAAAACGWFAWWSPGFRTAVQRIRGSSAAPAGGSAASAERRVLKSPAPARAAPVNRTPGASTAESASAAKLAAAAADAAPAGAGKTRVIVVHLPTLDAIGSSFVSQVQERLRAAGFDASDKQLSDPKNEPAWRMAPADMQSAQPGKSDIVVAVYLSGFEEQAVRACQVLACTSPPRVVDASDRKIFESSFQGRHIAVFAQIPAGAAKPPRK
jgi:protein phosphatase